MISIPELIAALQNLNFEPTDEDIADILWLALHMGPSVPEEPISHLEKDIERLDQAKKPLPGDEIHLEPQPPPQTDPIPKSTTDELYLVTQGEEIKALGPGAIPSQTPKVSALPGTLGLARALRPLMRRVPSQTQFIVDEMTTAQQIAEQGIWLPVLNPAPARWLELALVIDESISMNIWWQTIAELQLLLEHHGAFRDVRTWGLVTNTDGNNMQLRAGLGITTGKQQLRNPSELIEPSGRRLILVVSDCVSSSWYTGAILEILAGWGQTCPVAIIQVLPRWLWTKSVLRDSVTADLYTRIPGLPNMQLDYNSSSYWMDNEELRGWLPMPIVTLEQKSLSIWAKAIMSSGNAWMPGYMFDIQKKRRVPEHKTALDQKASASLTAEQRLKRFRATASPAARALTELLAATPITLPIVRFIQQSMLSESQKGQFIDQQGHIAEIFLSGLLEQLPMNEDVVDPDQVQYDFVDGVRELLLSSLPRSESVRVLMKFTDFVESHADQFPNLTALLADPMSATEVSLVEKSRPFAIVTAQVLRRLGGGYIPLAEQIERVSTDLSTKVEFPEIPIEAPQPAATVMTEFPVEQAVIDAALQQLNELPLESLPTVGSLPTGSRLPALVRNPSFVDREMELRRLGALLKGSELATAVITGLGGIGKSQLAIEFVYRYGQYFRGGVFWLNFAYKDAIPAEVAACRTALGQELRLDAAALPLAEQVLLVLSAWQNALPRLLVFDSCEDEALLKQWRPPVGGCRILITSRRADWHPDLNVQPLPLDDLPRQESVTLLGKYRADLSPTDRDAIANEVGDLPLALALAGKYLQEYQGSRLGEPAAYLSSLRRMTPLQHPSLAEEGLNYSTGHVQNVERTFALSYEQLDPTNALDATALKLLARAAYFAPGEPIPRDLLRASLEEPEDDQLEGLVAQALQRLGALGLLDKQPGDTYRMHPLLALFVRERSVSTDTQAQRDVEQVLLEQAQELNAAGYSAPLLVLQPHLRVVTHDALQQEDDLAPSLCNELGLYLMHLGAYSEAQSYLEQALTIRERVRGAEHPDVAQSLNNLAELYRDQGKYEQAEPLYQRALNIWEQQLGPEHPDVATSLNGLATLYRAQGKYEQAEPLYQRALAIDEKALGPEHPDVAQSLNNLAELYRDQGKYEQAEPLYQRALNIWEQQLGPEHPDVATTLNNLAELYRDQGKYEQAEPLYQRALAIDDKALGAEHAEQIERVSTDLSTKVEFPESPIEAPFPAYSEITNTANTASQGYKILSGSERKSLPNSRPVGPVDPHEPVEVTVYLRAPATSNLANTISERVQRQGRPMSRQEYSATQSASPDDLAKVEEFARKNGLTVVETDPVGRRVVLAGTAAAMSAAFATELRRYEHPGGTYRGRTGPLHIPSELDQVTVGVFGLDDRPQARPHFQRFDRVAGGKETKAAAISYTPSQLAQLYGFQTTLNGSGQCIALIELGGGYKNQDLQTYFQQLHIPLPRVTSVAVDHGRNHPAGTPNSADGEVDLDIEVAGAIAPGAHIVVYFAPNTDRGFLDAITKAIHDTANNPSVISISWGSAEVTWTAQAIQAMDQAFQAATALGITVCCAAGDNGSGEGVNDGLAHVDFPASSPYALGCGGTRLEMVSNQLTEVVWNDGPNSATGGGVSDFFNLPPWQANAGIPPSVNPGHRVGRGVPDVAGNADPQTGYNVYVDGQSSVFGGTGATASLWAGLIALMNQQRAQPVGYLNPILYQNYQSLIQAQALRDVTSGNNGAYSARPGWDACTGLGSPDGKLLWMELTR